MFFSGQSEIDSILQQIYNSLPGLDCGDCWGDCCVSPTVTAPEFVYLIQRALTDEVAKDLVFQAPTEHIGYPGNHHCRFQHRENGRCQVYEGRALACRLHGHEVLRSWATPEMEFCSKEPGGRDRLEKPRLDIQLEALREASRIAGLSYCEPYYFYSLNLECWLDFWRYPELSEGRPALASTRNYLDATLGPASGKRSAFTTLDGKLKQVDRLIAAVEKGDGNAALRCLESLQKDYPSVGSWWLAEARELEMVLLGNGPTIIE